MTMQNSNKVLAVMFLAGSILSLSACSGVKTEAKYPTSANRDKSQSNDIYNKPKSVLGDDGINLFGSKKNKNGSGQDGIGVNSFLWRATLDTVSFMPLASADPFGGVILTDWYTAPETPNERVKINAFIMGRELKSDGIRIRTFRQVQNRGQWVDAEVSDDTAHKLEDAILVRARQLRISHLADK